MTESAFICPFCEKGLVLPAEVWHYTCEFCGEKMELRSQFAYLRGLEAFSEGQELMQAINPKKRRMYPNVRESAAMELFIEAYSSLQVAFQHPLEETQRTIAVEMMSSMAQEFNKRNMVSPFEVMYWNSIMLEQTAQNEFDVLRQKLHNLNGALRWLKLWRWRNRQSQLLKYLGQLDSKIAAVEKQIAFVDVPRARNSHWKPQTNESFLQNFEDNEDQ
jgi:hypothetical protein